MMQGHRSFGMAILGAVDSKQRRLHDKFQPIGTERSGYSGPVKGGFRCGNCCFFSDGQCDHPEVVKDSEVKHEGHRAIVDENGCCNMFRTEDEGKDNGSPDEREEK